MPAMNMPAEQGRESFDTVSTPKASMDVGATPSRQINNAPPTQDVDSRTRLDGILHSDIGVNILLARLKQSISAARELSGFLKERASLEEKHFHGVQRLTRSTQELFGRPEIRQGSFAHNYREVGVIHDRMAKNSEDFAHNLHMMSEELQELAAHCERARKQWKHTGLEAEQKAQDADGAMEKAKQRYFSLAEQYDRVRTGERQGGKFGLKGPKSAAQQEESLLSKAENADQEYRSRVEAAQAQRHELLTSSRPQAVRELQNAIKECDAAVSMEMQKFAVLNEKLLLGNGLCVSPLKTQEDGSTPAGSRSLREVIQDINNQRDFDEYILSHSNNVGPTPGELRYEKHPALIPQQQQQYQPPSQQQSFNPPHRSNTGFGSLASSVNHGGQTSGITPSQVPPQPTPYHATQQGSNVSSAPQLPQIGALSMGGRNSLEGGRYEPPQGRNEGDYRNFSGPPQSRPNQSSYTGPTGYIPGTTAHHQVTNNFGSMGASPGRGAPLMASGSPQSAQPMPGQFPQGNRGSPLESQGDFRPPQGGQPMPGQFPHGKRGSPQEQQGDFRTQGKTSQQGPGFQTYQSEFQGPQSASQMQARDGKQPPIMSGGQGLQSETRHSPQQASGFQTYPSAGRGAATTSGPGTGFQAPQGDPRGVQQGPGYQARQGEGRGGPIVSGNSPLQPAGRGLPSQNNGMGQSGYGGPNNNTTSPTTGPPSNGRGPSGRPNLPPLKPVFGVSLDELFRRDGAAVPAIVYQCVMAVDLFGLDTEGIYRISGSAQHIMELQALFDHDSSQVNFRSPASFYNDIASVTTLLKHFLRDLPDPLLTSAQYSSFIQAAKIEDEIVRRDSLHAIINSLPDPNYATLRTLILHLSRVAQRSAQNRMTASNVAIVFGPTLMGGHGGGPSGEIQDAGWQARVVETILNNALQIFDDDD